MSAYKDPRDHKTWRYRCTVRMPDGTTCRISGKPSINTKLDAERAERADIEVTLNPPRAAAPTFHEWFNGRFWAEWVIARQNKPTERRSKERVYAKHLREFFGHLPIDKIGVAEIAKFRAHLAGLKTGRKGKPLSAKRTNLILCVLSKPLKYAADCDLIAKAPRIGLVKAERPEIVAWSYEQYARLLVAAKAEGADWYIAVCLAGEAGMRVGEVKALRWREDVDMIARTITVNQQTCDGDTTTPKGRTRRTVPMTSTVYAALKELAVVREGLVVRNLDGSPKPDGETDHAIARICRRAGLPVHYWHTLRHSFATHAALAGVNPWHLMKWLGHKRIDETMLYVDVATNHGREMPEPIREAGKGDHDPEVRIIRMLGARASLPTNPLAIPAGTPSKRLPRKLCQQAANANASPHLPRGQVREIADVPLALLCSGGGLRTPDPAVNSRLLYP